MAIPDYQTLMLPLLRTLQDGRPHPVGDIVQSLSDEFRLTAEEREQLLPSGRARLMRNRVGWATTYFVLTFWLVILIAAAIRRLTR